MRERKNIVLLFSKLPEAGLVKTRLSTLKDGIYSPEIAAHLFHCMLFDVVEIIMAAMDSLEAHPELAAAREGWADLQEAREANSNVRDADDVACDDSGDIRDTYQLVISVAPEANVAKMEQLFADAGTWPRPIEFICDKGANFDEHYNDAFQQCWDKGADCILSMGADMPALTKRDIYFGFEQLHRLCDVSRFPHSGIVLAPDQEMGVSVVGWTRETDFDHTGVYYCQDGLTVLPAYVNKAREAELPALWLPPIPDVDTMNDLMHNVTLVNALAYCAEADDICPPWRTVQAFQELGLNDIYVMPNDLFDPRDHLDEISGPAQ